MKNLIDTMMCYLAVFIYKSMNRLIRILGFVGISKLVNGYALFKPKSVWYLGPDSEFARQLKGENGH